MSMIRHPAVYTATPARNLVPGAGGAVWYPLHGDFTAGIEGLEPLVEVGTPSGSVWGTPLVWTAQTANTTNGAIAEDDVDNLYNNSQLSLVGMAVGDQFITCLRASYTIQPTGVASLWSHGKQNSTASQIGLNITSGQIPTFQHRSKGQTDGAYSATMTQAGGTAFSALRNAGIFALVMGVRPVSTTEVDVELRASNGTDSVHYTITALDLMSDVGATELPGVSGGISMANFVGLSIGFRNGASSPETFWGHAATSVGQIGDFAARKFATYDADRVADTLASMLARPGEFPRTLCRDYT